MKKKVITLLLSLVLVSGSTGHVQVLAAENTGQETEPVQEEVYEQEEEPVQEEEPAAEAEDAEPEKEPEGSEKGEEE